MNRQASAHLALGSVHVEKVTLPHGDSGARKSVALAPLASGAIGPEEDTEASGDEKDGNRHDGESCAPSRVRGHATIEESFEDRHLNDEGHTSSEVSPSSTVRQDDQTR